MRRRGVVLLEHCEACGERECEATEPDQCRAWTELAEQRARIGSAAGRAAWRERQANGAGA